MIKMFYERGQSLNILHSGFYWMPWPWGVETWKFCDYITFYLCHEGPEAWGFPLTSYKAWPRASFIDVGKQ